MFESAWPIEGRLRHFSSTTVAFDTLPALAGGNRDGELAEVFISGPKTGTGVRIASRDASIVASIALQFGASAEVLRRAIGRNSDGSAAGPLGKLLDILAKESAR
jgi:hypothetical protein